MKSVASLLAIFLLCMPMALLAQHGDTDAKSKPTVFNRVDKMPDFQGNIQEYLLHNVVYPAQALDSNIEGRVVVRFLIKADGSIAEVTIAKSVNPWLDEEAVRVVKQMPKWKPGMQEGKPVDVFFTLPIVFSFGNGDKDKAEGH